MTDTSLLSLETMSGLTPRLQKKIVSQQLRERNIEIATDSIGKVAGGVKDILIKLFDSDVVKAIPFNLLCWQVYSYYMEKSNQIYRKYLGMADNDPMKAVTLSKAESTKAFAQTFSLLAGFGTGVLVTKEMSGLIPFGGG